MLMSSFRRTGPGGRCGLETVFGLGRNVSRTKPEADLPSNRPTKSKLILILLSVFLPPLAVWLKTKSGKDTIINVILCFLFWIPAVLHSLYLIFK